MKVRILESKEVFNLKKKLQIFMKGLSVEERDLMIKALSKPTVLKLLNFCGQVRDKIDGKDDNEALKIQQFKAKQRQIHRQNLEK